MHKLYLKRNNNYFSLRIQIKLFAFLVYLTIPFFILFLYKIFLNCFISSLENTLNSKSIKNKVKEKFYQKCFIIFVKVIKLVHKLFISICYLFVVKRNKE